MSEDWLPSLRRDIPYLQQLGVNTISIACFDIAKSHDRALALLRDEGIHVLIRLLDNLKGALPNIPNKGNGAHEHLQPADIYTGDLIAEPLKVIEQTSQFPNVLAYQVSAGALITNPAIKFSTIIRAVVRDCKRYLRDGERRQIPVGVCTPDLVQFRKPWQRFFTAGEPEERADFFAFDCFSWAGDRSSFKISGYENMVSRLDDVPVPMFFSSYGATVTQPRSFSEVDCLYSPDMTGVFSGGVVYTYMRSDDTRYPLVNIAREGSRQRLRDFWYLEGRLTRLSNREDAQIFGQHQIKDYDGWRGEFPEKTDRFPGPDDVPPFPLVWENVLRALE